MVASVVEDFWTTLDHIDDAHHGTLHNPFIVATYLGLRVKRTSRAAMGRRRPGLQAGPHPAQLRQAAPPLHGEIRGERDLDTVRDRDVLRIITSASSGKVTRLHHTAHVLLAPSDARGRVRSGCC